MFVDLLWAVVSVTAQATAQLAVGCGAEECHQDGATVGFPQVEANSRPRDQLIGVADDGDGVVQQEQERRSDGDCYCVAGYSCQRAGLIQVHWLDQTPCVVHFRIHQHEEEALLVLHQAENP